MIKAIYNGIFGFKTMAIAIGIAWLVGNIGGGFIVYKLWGAADTRRQLANVQRQLDASNAATTAVNLQRERDQSELAQLRRSLNDVTTSVPEPNTECLPAEFVDRLRRAIGPGSAPGRRPARPSRVLQRSGGAPAPAARPGLNPAASR